MRNDHLIGGLIGGTADSALKTLSPYIFALVITLLLVGLTLAFYLPAIPFIQWWMGVVSWLIVTLEVMVAAPLWAAAHAFPQGEGLSGDRAQQGYMLFLRCLFHPSLMVIGFFLALVIFIPLCTLLGASFKVLVSGITGGAIGLWSIIVLPIMLGVLVIITAHKVFGLITWLPENVIRWLGQLHQSLGEGADSEKANRMILGGFGQTSGGISSAQKNFQEIAAENNKNKSNDTDDTDDVVPGDVASPAGGGGGGTDGSDGGSDSGGGTPDGNEPGDNRGSGDTGGGNGGISMLGGSGGGNGDVGGGNR